MTGRRDGLDIVLAVTTILLALGTVVFIAIPSFNGHVTGPSLDLVLDTVAMVVTMSVAILAWVRFQERRQPISLFQAAAFLVLALADATAVAVALRGSIASAESLASFSQAQHTVWTFARMVAAILLVVGGVGSLRGVRLRHPQALLAGPPILVLLVVALVFASGNILSSLFSTAGPTLDSSASPHLSATLFGAAVLLLEAVLLFWAAMLTRRLWQRDRSVGDAYVAVGLVFAAFGQLNEALFTTTHPLQLASSDILWLAFSLALILGIEAEARATLRALRQANESLERLRDAEVDRAALEERARLSRELHDGLAQDLWLAKLKAARLAAMPDLGDEATVLCDELGSAIDSGLADARQAVMALRVSVDGSDASLGVLLRRYTDDFQDRFALRVEVECDVTLPRLRPRVEAELLRIVQEALNNVRRHADATLATVRIFDVDGWLTLVVRDNGRGFEPSGVALDGFGLTSMRERASLIGGDFRIESYPADGTTIRVDIPLAPSMAPSGSVSAVAS